MKYKILFSIIISALFAGCKGPDEIPERYHRPENTYSVPNPEPLSESEREIIRQKRTEYQNAVE